MCHPGMNKTLLALSTIILLAFACEDSTGITDKTKREEDEQLLVQLYKEIEALSKSVSCTEADEWKFVAIGSKACGGPTGYMAYSTQINEEQFLEKVTYYTEQQKAFNTKWGIVSTCDIPAEPTDVICEDGKPVFVYSQ